jgi:AmmeMemoRadiSam system protein B
LVEEHLEFLHKRTRRFWYIAKTLNELNVNLQSLFSDSNFGPGKLPPSTSNERIYGMVCPHAGYMYSGAVAANGYYELSSSKFESAIIIGPNHYGLGSDVALMNKGSWKTPLGEINDQNWLKKYTKL